MAKHDIEVTYTRTQDFSAVIQVDIPDSMKDDSDALFDYVEGNWNSLVHSADAQAEQHDETDEVEEVTIIE